MTTLTTEIPDNVEKTLSDLIEQLGGKVISKAEQKKQSKSAKKAEILNNIDESVQWIKLYQEEKVKAKTIEELLDEL